ncbi:MAG: tyrosine-type recombinase/integrase [Prevotella sp.]|nr:tyrosine-type recombinase/integrase [Prevotella sp.]
MSSATREGRSTVYNDITSKEKLAQVNKDNLQLEDDFLEYLASIDRSKGTIKQYKANLHVFWCWNLEFNNNKFFVKLTKRDISRFQNHTLNVWGWSPKRIRTVKATLSSLSNYIENILDDEYEGYKPIVNKIENPANKTVRKRSVFDLEDLQSLLDMLVEKKQYEKACMLSLAINSGRRKNELIHFKASYFTEDNIICDGAFYKTPEKMRTKGRGSMGKMLDVYVFKKPFQHYLNMWMNERKEKHIKSDWLFPQKVNSKFIDEPLKTSTMDSWAKSFSDMMGKNFYWHSLRAYFVTHLSKNGVPDNVIQDILGWESADMVNVYNDTTADFKFDKYFGAEGIKTVEAKSLKDIE